MSDLNPPCLKIAQRVLGEPWAQAVQYIFGEDVTIYVREPAEEDSLKAGTVDVAVSSESLLVIDDLFPARYLALPWSARGSQGRYFLINFQYSLRDQGDIDAKILRFVSFYHNLLRFDGKSTINADTLAEPVRSICEKSTRTETKLLFVFGGKDPRRIEMGILESIAKVTGENAMTICGCEVICVWCPYSQLFNWRRALKFAEDIESSRQIAMQQLQDKLQEQFDEVRQLLDAKRHQQDEDNQQQAKHDEELRQKENFIAELRAERQRLEQDETPARKKRKLQPPDVLKSSDT